MFVFAHLSSGPVQTFALLDSLQAVLDMQLQSRMDLLLSPTRSRKGVSVRSKRGTHKAGGNRDARAPSFREYVARDARLRIMLGLFGCGPD